MGKFVENLIPVFDGEANGVMYSPAIQKMYIDPLDCLELSRKGYYEYLITELIKDEVHRGDIVINAGANIGYHTLILSRLVGDVGKVYAFEPEPRNYQLLVQNINENGCSNVIAVAKALSNKDEYTKLYVDSVNIGDNRLYASDDEREFVNVEAIRLDTYFNHMAYTRNANFIKMDIQGYEALALDGIAKIIKSNRYMKMVTEFWPNGIKMSGADPEVYLHNLESLGFEIYNIDEIHNRIEKRSVPDLLDEYSIESNKETDLFCVRRV